MHPVDHVVADIHRIGAFGQRVHLKGVAESGSFERLVPPACAFNQSLPYVFRSSRIDPILNRLDRLADGRIRVLLLKAMAPDVMLRNRFADRNAVIDKREVAVAGTRIIVTNLVVAVRQFNERIMLAHRDGVSRRRDARNRTGEEAASAGPSTALTDRVRSLSRSA